MKDDELEALPRRELQALCKRFGIKANSKTTTLIENLSEHYAAATEPVEDEEEEEDNVDDDSDAVPDELTESPPTKASPVKLPTPKQPSPRKSPAKQSSHFCVVHNSVMPSDGTELQLRAGRVWCVDLPFLLMPVGANPEYLDNHICSECVTRNLDRNTRVLSAHASPSPRRRRTISPKKQAVAKPTELQFTPARDVIEAEDEQLSAVGSRRETSRRETMVLDRSTLRKTHVPTVTASLTQSKLSQQPRTSQPVMPPLVDATESVGKVSHRHHRIASSATSRLPRSMQKVALKKTTFKRHAEELAAKAATKAELRQQREQEREALHQAARNIPAAIADEAPSSTRRVVKTTVQRKRRPTDTTSSQLPTPNKSVFQSPLPSSPSVRKQRGERLDVKSLGSVQLPERRAQVSGEDTDYSRRVEALLATVTDENELLAQATKRSKLMSRSPPSGLESLSTSLQELANMSRVELEDVPIDTSTTSRMDMSTDSRGESTRTTTTVVRRVSKVTSSRTTGSSSAMPASKMSMSVAASQPAGKSAGPIFG
jgi:hypothetical protein